MTPEPEVEYRDRTLRCIECLGWFTFEAGEQRYYAERQFVDPRRCAPCREAKKAARAEREQ